MNIAKFEIEQWMNDYEDRAKYNIAESCAEIISLEELLEIVGEDKNTRLFITNSLSFTPLSLQLLSSAVRMPVLFSHFHEYLPDEM